MPDKWDQYAQPEQASGDKWAQYAEPTLPQAVATPTTPAPHNTVTDALRGAYQNSLGPLLHSLSPSNLMGSADRLPGSVKSGQQVPLQEAAAQDNATKTFSDPKASAADKFDSVVYMLPGIGPQLKHLDELHKAGKHAEAYGGAAGVIASLLGPKLLSGAAPAVADAMDAGAAKVSPNVSNMMNKYIGLQPSDLAKYEKFNPGAPEEIGNAVYEHAGLKNNLKAQHQAIVDALERKQGEQGALIENAAGKPIDVQHLLFDKAVSLQDELRNAEGDTPRVGAVGNNWEALHSRYGHNMSPADAVEMRNSLRGRITDWNPKTQNVEQRYLQDVYHGLNDEVANSLNPIEQINWRINNRAMNRLIIAKDAAGQKLVGQAMQYEGPIKTAASKAGKLITPSKWAENIPEGADRKAAMAPASALRAASGVTRLAGESNLNRILHTPLIENDNDQQ